MEILKMVWVNYIRHAADILLVAYLIYRMMLLVRGTRSVQVLQGILLLAVGTWLVNDIMALPLMRWLLEKFWMAGIMVLAVVFQPEIRAALAQLGGQPVSRWILPARLEFINEIVAALKECSERRIGALVVLEQDTGLKNFSETGTRVHGEISMELILSILHPRAPLHDGALIVSGNQIAAAGCVLPLTDDPHFAKLLGTRHRAAVGLSECSDAIVLVVSEETGQLSIAREGRLDRNLEFEQVREQLFSLYRAKSDRPLLRKSDAPRVEES